MTVRSYATPAAFKKALEQRLKDSSRDGGDLNRRRQLLVFDRLLARLVHALGDAVILKGGLVLELRLERARTTKDVDVRLSGSADDLLPKLQEIGQERLGDFMTFVVVVDPDLPEITGDGMKYEGYRFRAECRLAGKVYGQRFGIDVAFGDPLIGKPDVLTTDDTLAFAGIAPPTVLLYPAVSHIAEKLHAYTMPRQRPNTRVKDLPDIALLASLGAIRSAELKQAIDRTFEFRGTHPVPIAVPMPSPSWEKPYAAMAKKDELQWPDLEAVTKIAASFLDPILSADVDRTWQPSSWEWR